MPVFKKILDSQRGGKILIDGDGYLYNYLRETNKGSTWACRRKYKLNCYSRVYYRKELGTIELTAEHNHPPKPGEAVSIELMRTLKQTTPITASRSYKIRKDLMKSLQIEEMKEDDLPTLLTSMKRRKKNMNTSDINIKDKEDDVIIDVDSMSIAPAISSVQTWVDNTEVYPPEVSNTGNTGNTSSEVQDLLQQLLTEPELLLGLVNLISDHNPDQNPDEQEKIEVEEPETQALVEEPQVLETEPIMVAGHSEPGHSEPGQAPSGGDPAELGQITSFVVGEDGQINKEQVSESLQMVKDSGLFSQLQDQIQELEEILNQQKMINQTVNGSDILSIVNDMLATEQSAQSLEQLPANQQVIDNSSPERVLITQTPEQQQEEQHQEEHKQNQEDRNQEEPTRKAKRRKTKKLGRPKKPQTVPYNIAKYPRQSHSQQQRERQLLQQVTTDGHQETVTPNGPQETAISNCHSVPTSDPLPAYQPTTYTDINGITKIVGLRSHEGGFIPLVSAGAVIGNFSINTPNSIQFLNNGLPEQNNLIINLQSGAGSPVIVSPVRGEPIVPNHTCTQCNNTFTATEQLDTHYRNLNRCEPCKMAFCVQEHFDRHNELNHPDGKKSGWGTLCETCGRVFGVVFQLDVHRAKCANRLSYRCPRCFFSFGFEHDLYRHKLSHDSYLGTSAYSCKDCNKVFSSAFRLQTHVTRRYGNKPASEYKGPWYCSLCDKKTCMELGYVKHISRHRGNSRPDLIAVDSD